MNVPPFAPRRPFALPGSTPNCTTPQAEPCGDERRKCVVIDDQFAAVPRAHADHYFLRRDSRPPGTPTHAVLLLGGDGGGAEEGAASGASGAVVTAEAARARFVARRWLDRRMVGWHRCCEPSLMPRDVKTAVPVWNEVSHHRTAPGKIANAVASNVGPWRGGMGRGRRRGLAPRAPTAVRVAGARRERESERASESEREKEREGEEERKRERKRAREEE